MLVGRRCKGMTHQHGGVARMAAAAPGSGACTFVCVEAVHDLLKWLRPISVMNHLRARCVRPLQMIHNDRHAELSSSRHALHSLPSVRGLRKSAAHRYRHRRCQDIRLRRRHGARDRRHRRERQRRCLRNIHGWRIEQHRIRRSWRIVHERRLGWSTFVRRHCLWSTAGYLQKGHPRGGRLLPHLHGHRV